MRAEKRRVFRQATEEFTRLGKAAEELTVRADQVGALSKEFHALASRYTVNGGFSFGTESTEWGDDRG